MPQKPKASPSYVRYEGSGIGERIARLRAKRGLSQTELAQRMGITRVRLSHYESGRRQLSAELLARVAIELGVRADELLGLVQGETSTYAVVPTRIMKLVYQSLNLPVDQRRVVYRIMRTFVESEDSSAPVETHRKPRPTRQRPSRVSQRKARPVRATDDDRLRKHTGAWTAEEVEVLELYYPRCEDRAVILELLPGRSWNDCAVKAGELGITRLVDEREIARRKTPKRVLPKKKLERLLNQDLTVDEIAHRLETTAEIVRRLMWRYGL